LTGVSYSYYSRYCMYNLYNLEAVSLIESILSNFKKSLHAEKISSGSIRSYLSDVRYFLNWFVAFLEQNKILEKNEFDHLSSVSLLFRINQTILEVFKNHQVDNNVPQKTINRRFSSLRKFGSFCQSQNWMRSSPFDTLKNISDHQPFPENEFHLAEFRACLWKNNSSKATMKNYLGDTRQFLAWRKKFKVQNSK